VSYIISTAAI
jgi:quinolinate synthase